MSPQDPTTTYSDRILAELLRLHAAGALPLERVADANGVHRFRFRSGGWPVVVDLDDTVLEVRAYYGDHTIATGRVRDAVMRRLSSDSPATNGRGNAAAAEALAALRALVHEWKSGNPRVFMESPSVARHPDGWNNS